MVIGLIGKIVRNSLLILNWLAAGLWLGSCYEGKTDAELFWWLGLLPLISFFLLASLLAFMVLWLFLKPRLIWISLAAIIIGWPAMQNIVQWRLPQEQQKKSENALRILTWNVEHFDIKEHKTRPDIRDSMIDLIKDCEPDVACFQEMVASDSISSAINYIPYFSRKLNMKYRTFSYNTRLNYDKKHHFGIITFSKYPIINRKTLGFPPYDYNSIFQYSDIVKGTDTIRVFNVHLQSQKFNKQNRDYAENPSLSRDSVLEESQSLIRKLRRALIKRREQSNHVREEIEKSPYPVILCGDFNDVPNSYAYYHIGEGMQDAFKAKGSGLDRTYLGISRTLRIDYIFSQPSFEVARYDRIKKKFSDHYPVMADLFLKRDSLK
mgnify:CR=1 FL=1